MINWEKNGKEDLVRITKIAKRAVKIIPEIDFMTVEMDISACNTVTPLKLDKLLKADKFNFCHDVLGINRHINHETGELENCFLPRFAC